MREYAGVLKVLLIVNVVSRAANIGLSDSPGRHQCLKRRSRMKP